MDESDTSRKEKIEREEKREKINKSTQFVHFLSNSLT
jgi:hypothetical protein